MVSNGQLNSISEYEVINLENEIERNRFFSVLKKSKRFISIFSLTGLLISSVFAYSIKKTYQGEFQIVIDLENKKDAISAKASSLGADDTILNNLFDSSSSRKYQLQTEVGILKSPSVLKNIFNFVKEQKTTLKSKDLINLQYSSWAKNNLDIDLQKGTNILNISYRDKDRDLIIPVLYEISKSYQKYSGKKRSRGLELGLDFINKQINNYKERSYDSMKAAQLFAINNELPLKQSTESFNIEDDFLIKRIKELNFKLSARKNIYKPNDEITRKLELERKSLSASRRKEVLIEYFRLISKATKDQQTLESLEIQNTVLLLEKAKRKDPWELITKPTIINSPYAPRKKRIMALGLLTGLFFGILSSLLIARFKDKVLTSKEVKLLTNWKFISEIDSSEEKAFNQSIELFCKFIDNQKIQELSILIIEDFDDLILERFTKTTYEYLKNTNLKVTSNLNEVISSSNLVILIAINITTKKKLISTLQKLSIREEPTGYIVLI